jgi:hypothetical protein
MRTRWERRTVFIGRASGLTTSFSVCQADSENAEAEQKTRRFRKFFAG